MKTISINPKPIRRNLMKNGFALIATLLIMTLLTVLAFAMMSLSNSTTRSTNITGGMAEAQANARMALMIAIGELQRHTGPDTRITAPAELLEAGAPPLTGVWRSWEGTNHDATGRPIVPNYDGVKTTREADGGRFLTWLVSGAQTGQQPLQLNLTPSDLVSSVATARTIPLLSTGTLGANLGQVHVAKQLLQDESSVTTGAYAWWVSPENQKVRLAHPHAPRTNDVLGYAEMGQSHTAPNPEVFGLAATLTDLENHTPDPANAKVIRKAITLNTTEFVAANNTANPQQKFHDISTSSIGLLTNSATGGWRKDMSILTEKWNEIYASYPSGLLPLFRYTPAAGSTSLVPKPVFPAVATTTVTSVAGPAALAAANPDMSNLYPWSNYSLILGFTQPGTYHAASASWASLRSFATSYKNFTNYSGEVRSPFVMNAIAKQRSTDIRVSEMYNHKNRQSLLPQIARFQLIVYARAIEDPARLGLSPPRYQIQLMYTPFITMWNPYNVSLEHTISGTLGWGERNPDGTAVWNEGQRVAQTHNFLGFGWRRSLPGAMAIRPKAWNPDPDTILDSHYRMFNNGNFQTLDSPSNNVNPYDHSLPDNTAKFTTGPWRDLRTWSMWLPEGTITFKPGEAKIMSIDYFDPGYGFGGTAFVLKEGYNPTQQAGLQFNFWNNQASTGAFWFKFRNDRATQPYLNRIPGYGLSLSFGSGGSHFGGYSGVPSGIGPEFHNVTSLSSLADGDNYWPADEIDELGYTVGELASGMLDPADVPWIPLYSANFGPRMTIGTAPGTLQNRPTKGFVQNNALAGMVISDPASGLGKDHPANNTYDFAYQSLSIGSTITPNLSASEGYIVTGHQSGDGLKRFITTEIPLRPMSSLVELQGWNPRGHNPFPPFQMNQIGNSDATPLIPKNDIVPVEMSPNSVATNLMHDDAYCANHVLFDDWFVSSIAPQLDQLGGSVTKDIETVYREFLTGDYILSNRAYRGISEDQKLTTAAANTRVGEIINSTAGDGWLKIASRLEVEGMFNINSTSVDAWRAILGHAKSRAEIAMHGAAGMISTTADNDHPVTRGAIASDVEAGKANNSAAFNNASEFTGFRSLTDAQIDDLAGKIVEQVRARGPFLSLSEFVNRQLSSNDNLAIAGAVQTAINNLDADPMAVLRNQANNLSADTMPANHPKLVGADYAFPEAAVGSSAHGVPGWIRQADILRPIAPIISARDDTFTVRAYGESIDVNGNVTARAWCEATVVRTRNFSDPNDAPDRIDPPSAPANINHGRKYEITAFRWLNENEV